MANTFKNKIGSAIGTTLTDIYTVSSGATATIIGCSLANLSEDAIYVDVKLYDNSAATGVYIIKSAPIPVGGTLVVVGGDQKMILESLDKIQVQSDTESSVDVIISTLEVT